MNLNCLGHPWVMLCASGVLPAPLWYSDPSSHTSREGDATGCP